MELIDIDNIVRNAPGTNHRVISQIQLLTMNITDIVDSMYVRVQTAMTMVLHRQLTDDEKTLALRYVRSRIRSSLEAWWNSIPGGTQTWQPQRTTTPSSPSLEDNSKSR